MISGPRRSQSWTRSKLCFSSHFLSLPRAPLSDLTYSARNGMRSVSLVESEAGMPSRIRASFSCFAPQNPTLRSKSLASCRLPITSLISPLAYSARRRDDAELEQQVLHVAGQLLRSAWSTRSGSCSCPRYDTHPSPSNSACRNACLTSSPARHTNSGMHFSALLRSGNSASGLASTVSRVLRFKAMEHLARAAGPSPRTNRIPPTTASYALEDRIEERPICVVEADTLPRGPTFGYQRAGEERGVELVPGSARRESRRRGGTRSPACRARSPRAASTAASARRRPAPRTAPGGCAYR